MRVAVIGLGFMGALHARAWTRVQGADLFAVVGRDERKLTGDLRGAGGNLATDAVRLDFSQVRKYKTYEEALADREIDAIDLCVPTDQHAGAAIRALRAGKHVLVEKPLALSGEDAERVAREAELSGRVLMVAHVLRFMPAYLAARERIAHLGEVRHATFRRRCAAPSWSAWLNDPLRSGGGAFDLLIHDADFARWLFGMPESIQASGAVDPNTGLDLVTADLRYPNLSVTITGGWHLTTAYPFSMEFTIACQNGVLEYCCALLTEYRLGVSPVHMQLAAIDPFESELAHFHECAMANSASTVCPINESVDAVCLMERILRLRGA